MFVDNHRIGTSDDSRLVLPAGQYTIELVNDDYNYHGEMVVNVRAGRVTSRTVELPTAVVQVNTDEGAEVLIEGHSVGVAPLGDIDVPIGTRQITVRSQDAGERRTAIVVRAGQVNEVNLPLSGMAPLNRNPRESLPSLSAPGPTLHGAK
jgi:hypothetical protein